MPRGAPKIRQAPAFNKTEETAKEYDELELDSPTVEEYTPDELELLMEQAAEQLIERFHMSTRLSEDYRRRVHPGAEVRLAA